MTVTSPFAEGQLLAGKYRVERVLGQGGMGVVLAARHIHLEERVAIKLMLAEAAFSPEAVARFVREARAAARLESAHVAKVSDVGTLEDGRPFMVMEYLDGADLSQVLASSGPLSVSDAVDYLLQAGEAIAEAHSLGIVHRDLKPANLFLTRRRDRTPHVKVLDFGISKVAAAAGSEQAMTRTSAMMGSPLYMSPEQMTSVRDVDGRSDIWALGIILFELLTGSPPFVGETLPQVCGLVIQTEAPLASSRRPDLTPEIDEIIRRCLAKDPGQRFQNVAELAQALQPLASRYGRSSAERILLLAGGGEVPSLPQPLAERVAKAVTAQVPGTHAAWGDTRPPAAAAKGKGWLAALAGVVAVLGGAAWWLSTPHGDVVPIAASASGGPVAELPPLPLLAPTPATAPSAVPQPEAADSAVASATSSVAATLPNTAPRPATARRPNPSLMKSAAPISSPPKPQVQAVTAAPQTTATPAAKASAEPKKPAPGLGGRL
jgi:serine/threonine-protein kinase